MSMKLKNSIGLAVCLFAGTAIAAETGSETVSVKAMADALHMVMDSDRTVYTRKIVNRLAKKDKVITASEHYDGEKALVLPAQMLR